MSETVDVSGTVFGVPKLPQSVKVTYPGMETAKGVKWSDLKSETVDLIAAELVANIKALHASE